MNRLKSWYFLLWIVAAVLAGFIYFRAFKPTTFIGVVETKEHLVSSVEAGVISQLFVKIGDEVKTGQELAQIYSADVRDLDSFRAMADLLRIEGTFRDELAELEARKAEIEGLNAQISRLKNASDKGVITSQDLAELTIKRDALQRHVQEQLKLLSELEKRYFVDQSSDGEKTATNTSGKSTVIERYKKHLQSLHTRFVELEKRVNSGQVVSPCDGKVIAINSRSGDMVDAFQPFLTVVESSPTHMEAYIPENAELTLKEGARVSIISRRPRVKMTGGTVTFVHQEVSPLPERLIVTRTQPWVRKVYIELDSPHDLLPGEKVRVKLASDDLGLTSKGK